MDDDITLAGLKERGWTATLVQRFLGAPERTAPNPHYRSGPPMRLYLLTRVEAAEADEAFKEARAGSRRRGDAARRVADRKRADLIARAEAMPVRVRQLGDDELLRQAIRHYNRRQEEWMESRWEHPDRQPARPDSDPLFLRRIKVNFIRHQMTSYDRALDSMAARVGVREASAVIRRKVYEAICSAYPGLAGECRRQYLDREGGELPMGVGAATGT
jgi:hypothetical protein